MPAQPRPRRRPDGPRAGSRRARLAVALASLLAAGIGTAGAAQASSTVPLGTFAAGADGAGAGTGDVPVPPTPANLPAGIEVASPYVKQVACDPTPKPGAVALGKLLVATYPGTSYGISRPCGTDASASEHYEGRAVDWMTSVRDPQGAARAEALIRWLLAPDAAGHAFANARRLGVMYLIWNDRIWGAYSASAGWRPYSSCASHPDRSYDTGCHRDHVHVSLSWAGALGRTSYWTGRVAATDYGPCRPADLNWAPPYGGPNPAACRSFGAVTARAGSSALAASLARYSGAVVTVGSSGPVVVAVQQAVGVTADGQFGQQTGAAVSAFRTAHGLPASAVVDAAAWRALLAAAPAGSGSGSGGGTTTARPAPSASGAAPSPTASQPVAVLSYGATGARVSALKRALHVTPVSGWFGPVTRKAVAAYQAAHRLPVTGSLDRATAAALHV